MKIKIIDLLNRIADGEELPKKIKYDSKTYCIDDFEHFYINDDNKGLFEEIFYTYNDYDSLNEKVEIIEEDKKIEKIEDLNSDYYVKARDCMGFTKEIALDIKTIKDKINEIIDVINRGD